MNYSLLQLSICQLQLELKDLFQRLHLLFDSNKLSCIAIDIRLHLILMTLC